MSFYIIERQEQLERLGEFNDCYVDFISLNDNFHPKLTTLSLIYIRSLNQHKGYILCVNHNESLSLDIKDVISFLLNKCNKLFVTNKKVVLYHFPYSQKLFDISFINSNDVTPQIYAFTFYSRVKYNNINKLIPISKHYEKCEKTFDSILPIIHEFSEENAIYAFNNALFTEVFHKIELNGIKIDKQCFIDCYGNDLTHPEYNIKKGRIYSQYNLYTMTSRPSNSYNSINFAALNKTDGERLCYIPQNDSLLEIDIQGYHPRIIGELINFNFPQNRNAYDTLGELLNVTQHEAKELTFKQLYGGVWDEYVDKPFFKDVKVYVDDVWKMFRLTGHIDTPIKSFTRELEDMNPQKLFNYIIQSWETYKNVIMLDKIHDYLKDKQSKIILYTYDAFLFDIVKEEKEELIKNLIEIIKYPTSIKQGASYHGLKKI